MESTQFPQAIFDMIRKLQRLYIVSVSVVERIGNVMSFNTSQGWRFSSIWFKRYGKEVERHHTHKLRICKCSAIFDMIRKPQRLYIVSDSIVECLRNVMSFNTSQGWRFISVWFKRYVCFAVLVTADVFLNHSICGPVRGLDSPAYLNTHAKRMMS